MAAPIIPKEQLTAYQRWELLGFEDSKKEAKAKSGDEVAVSLPTAEELERIHQQASREGFQIGKDEGYKAGYDAGMKAAQAVARRLEEVAKALDKERLSQDEVVANELLELALAVAKQMLRTTLQVKRGMVLEIIREALSALPNLNGHLRIMVHPDDVAPMQEFMTSEHAHLSFRVAADSRIAQGGFRIESSHSEVDGQLPVRWREIVECLGSDDSWLE